MWETHIWNICTFVRQRLSVPRLNVTLILGVSCVEEVQSEEKNSWIIPSVVKSQQQVTEILYMCPCSCLQGKLPDNCCHCYLFSGCVELFVHCKTEPSHFFRSLSECNLPLAWQSCSCACHGGLWGSGCTVPLILNLGTRWEWVVSFTTWPLYSQGKKPQYLLTRRLGGTQYQFGCFWNVKNLLHLLEMNHNFWNQLCCPIWVGILCDFRLPP